MNRYRSGLIAAVFCSCVQAASVTVVLKSPAGLPVSATATTILRDPADGTGSGKVIFSNMSDANGTVAANISSAGHYFVCAGSLAAELLDSCQWPNSSASFAVPGASGSSASAAPLKVTVTLQSGVTLRLHVNDPQGLVPTGAHPKATGFLRAGVWVDGRFRAAQLISVDSSGPNYSLVVPIGAALHISFQAANLQVLDSSGQKVGPALGSVSFAAPSTLSSAVQQFSVAPVSAVPAP